MGEHLNKAADLAKDESGDAKRAWAAFVGSTSLLAAQQNFATLKTAAGVTPLSEFTSKIHSARQFFTRLETRKTDGCRASGCGYNPASDPCCKMPRHPLPVATLFTRADGRVVTDDASLYARLGVCGVCIALAASAVDDFVHGQISHMILCPPRVVFVSSLSATNTHPKV